MTLTVTPLTDLGKPKRKTFQKGFWTLDTTKNTGDARIKWTLDEADINPQRRQYLEMWCQQMRTRLKAQQPRAQTAPVEDMNPVPSSDGSSQPSVQL